MRAAAAQFPQYRFMRSTITSASLERPSYLRQLAAFPLPDSAQHCLGSLPAAIPRASCAHQLIAAVSSEHDVKLYNYAVGGGASNAPPSLEAYGVLRGHTRAVQDVAFHNVHVSFDNAHVQTAPEGRCMLSTASEDGTIKFWDVRQQKPALEFRHPKGKPFISCASRENLLVGASGAVLWVWDLRTAGAAPLAENDDFHTEDINALAFHPCDTTGGSRGTILTGSEDGLICVLHPDEADQDDWLHNVLNIENPVSRFGFFGPQAQFLWALSTVETLTLWNIEECERLSDFENIRDGLSRSAHMPIDYLVGAHYEQQSQRLFLAAGCNDGSLVLNHVNRNEIQPFCLAHVDKRPEQDASADAAAPAAASASVSAVTGFSLAPLPTDSPFALSSLSILGPPTASVSVSAGGSSDMEDEEPDVLRDGEVVYPQASGDSGMGEGEDEPAPARPIDAAAQGHTATIRDVLWFRNALVTGGEDSRICLWTTQEMGGAQPGAAASSLKVKQHGAAAGATPSPPAQSIRHKPY